MVYKKRKPNWCQNKDIKCTRCSKRNRCRWTKMSVLEQEHMLGIHKTLETFNDK